MKHTYKTRWILHYLKSHQHHAGGIHINQINQEYARNVTGDKVVTNKAASTLRKLIELGCVKGMGKGYYMFIKNLP